MTKKKQCRKLTAAEKKAVWSTKTEENAGVGWNPHGVEPVSRYPEYNRQTPKSVDKEFK